MPLEMVHRENEYKLVSLISINADKRGSHIAVRDALKECWV